jgi:FkbM family methyltransferase
MMHPLLGFASRLRQRLTLDLKKVVYFGRGEPYRINGHTLRYLPGTRPIRVRYASSANRVNRYDALQIKLLSAALSEGDTAIDIGAHSGQYAVLMAALCGHSGRVIAFEPDPYARQQLMTNIGLNPRLRRPVVEDVAVSDRPGSAVLYSRGGNAQSSLARSGVESQAHSDTEAIDIKLTTLDDYLREHHVPEPSWVKIDAEGAEIKILRGAPGLLAGKAQILCELHPYVWPEMGDTLDELRALVAASGRRMRYLDQTVEVGAHVEYGTVLLERKG